MNITLNNRSEVLDQNNITISQLLEIKNYTFKMLVIKVNGELVKKDQYKSFIVKEGDDVNVLHLISGG
ncbi:MAG: thiamine biosynthesis protein ThiS [Bacteroidetes bacterium GWF2_33_16]|nr:MAG: thiamine biosynthesis protein ThiS [Bacteroidetes bacterium GWE2_32_14]OFY08774.1 MAG: thiamine biosynthesis protein ThiS [Bacteroidetes bacterium GWF2_33_16]